jgi:hypothetical protein
MTFQFLACVLYVQTWWDMVKKSAKRMMIIVPLKPMALATLAKVIIRITSKALGSKAWKEDRVAAKRNPKNAVVVVGGHSPDMGLCVDSLGSDFWLFGGLQNLKCAS